MGAEHSAPFDPNARATVVLKQVNKDFPTVLRSDVGGENCILLAYQNRGKRVDFLNMSLKDIQEVMADAEPGATLYFQPPFNTPFTMDVSAPVRVTFHEPHKRARK